MTTYYIRTIEDEYASNISNQFYGNSDNSHYQTFDATADLGSTYGPYGIKPNRFFDYNQRIYFFNIGSTPSIRANPPPRNLVSVIATVPSNLFWSNRWGDPNESTVIGWRMTYWGDQGWVNPSTNYSGWLTDICTAFDTVNQGSVVTLNSRINVVVCKYRFANTPASGTYFLFPVFYVGNDSNRDSEVVV